MVRLYVDEQLAHFVDALSEAGHDVVFAGEVGRAGRTDAWHFRQAIESQRVIVTFNRQDFEYLHRLWTTLVTLGVVAKHHSGMLTSFPTPDFTPIDWLDPLLERLVGTSAQPGQLVRWLPGSRRWRDDQFRSEQD
jgi:hypothetical protein